MLIEFDPDKDRINQEKHGVSIAVAAEIDVDDVLSFEDPRPYEGETRHIGYAPIGGRLYAFWYTWRGEIVRVIGIRKANPKEVARYDEHR